MRESGITEEQFNKLPKYAQEEIRYLRMREGELLDALKKSNHYAADPVAIVDNYQDEYSRPALFGWEQVTFRMDGQTFSKNEDGHYHASCSVPEISIGLDRQDNHLIVRSASGPLLVTPSASNCLLLSVKDR